MFAVLPPLVWAWIGHIEHEGQKIDPLMSCLDKSSIDHLTVIIYPNNRSRPCFERNSGVFSTFTPDVHKQRRLQPIDKSRVERCFLSGISRGVGAVLGVALPRGSSHTGRLKPRNEPTQLFQHEGQTIPREGLLITLGKIS